MTALKLLALHVGRFLLLSGLLIGPWSGLNATRGEEPNPPAPAEPPPADPAFPEVPKIKSVREYLSAAGIGVEKLNALGGGEPLAGKQFSVLAEVLNRLPEIDPAAAERWSEKPPEWKQFSEEPDAHRGRLYHLRATATRVEAVQPEQADQDEGNPIGVLFRVTATTEDGQPLVLFTRRVPRLWAKDVKISEPLGCRGLFLKAGAETDDRPALIFATDHLAWYPQRTIERDGGEVDYSYLSRLGFDATLLDAVYDERADRKSESRCFHALLEAAGRAELDVLSRQARRGVKLQQLITRPAAHRGQLVWLKATAQHITPIKIEDPRAKQQFGFNEYYQIFALVSEQIQIEDPEDKGAKVVLPNYPVIFCVRQLPADMPRGNNIHETIEIPAFFFKLRPYQTQLLQEPDRKDISLRPIFVGLQPYWRPDELPGSGPRRMLEQLGIGEKSFDVLEDGQPLSQAEESLLARMLAKAPQYPPERLRPWRRTGVTLDQPLEEPHKFRLHVFDISGWATAVKRIDLPAAAADAAAKVEDERVTGYRVTIDALGTPNPVTAYVRDVPARWLNLERLDVEQFSERVGLTGLFLKTETGEDRPTLAFAAERVEWYPRVARASIEADAGPAMLGSLKMDAGLFDLARQAAGGAWPPRQLDAESPPDARAFFALLAALSRDTPRAARLRKGTPLDLDRLIHEGKQATGAVVRFEGMARSIRKVPIEDLTVRRRYFIDHYYAADIFVEQHVGDAARAAEAKLARHRLQVCFLRLPDGLPTGEDVNEKLRVTAFFYRNAQVAGAPEDGATVTPVLASLIPHWLREYTGPRDFLSRRYQIDESFFHALVDGIPVMVDEAETLTGVLRRMPDFSLADLERWRRQARWEEVVAEPKKFRASAMHVRGRATRVDEIPVLEENVERLGFDSYYRVAMAMDGAPYPVEVYARKVPSAWLAQEGKKIDEPASFPGLFLKVGDKSGAHPQLVFTADRVAWYPEEAYVKGRIGEDLLLLSQLGMDMGLMDRLRTLNKQPLTESREDSEPFYQMLSAATGLTDRRIARQGDSWFDLVELITQPQLHQGRLVTIEGVARRVVKIPIESEEVRYRFGMDHYYEMYVFVDQRIRIRSDKDDGEGALFTSYPIVCCVTELPDGMDQGSSARVPVRLTGIFYRLIGYETEFIQQKGQKYQLSPLLVARRVEELEPAEEDYSTLSLILGISFCVVLLAVVLVIWRSNRKDDEVERQLIERRHEQSDSPRVDDSVEVDVQPRR